MATFQEISNYFQTSASFTSAIPFTKGTTYMNTTVTSNLSFTPNASGSIPLSNTLVIAVADGIHSASFSGFNKLSTSGNFSTGSNNINLIRFFFDGINYYYELANAGSVQVSDPILNISNLVRYYDAQTSALTLSGSNILSVSDLSTLQVNATTASNFPQWNSGKGGIDFGSKEQFSIGSFQSGGTLSMAYVMEFDTTGNSLSIFAGGVNNFYVQLTGSIYQNIDGGHSENFALTQSMNVGDKAVFVYTIDANKLVSVYKNGSIIGAISSSANPAATSAAIVFWGADAGASGRTPMGTMYSYILANKTFSSGDIATITSTLKSRYSIA